MKKLLFITFIHLFLIQLNGQNLIESCKVVSSDRGFYEVYGRSVSINGEFAIVGVPRDDNDINGLDSLNSAGSAFLYFKNDEGVWTQLQKIVASDRQEGDSFGHSVSLYGDYAIVGAQKEWHDTNGGNGLYAAGSAYIFKRNQSGVWTEIQKITASDRDAGDEFGFSIYINDIYAIVGARQDDEDASGENPIENSGAAYIFKQEDNGTWYEMQKIVAADRHVHDLFGWTVGIDDSVSIVGAYHNSYDALGYDSLFHAGSAYIFELNDNGTWIQLQKIVASDRESEDLFGDDVAIEGNYAIVGSRLEDEDSLGANTLENSGSAYMFEKSEPGNWVQVQKIVAIDRYEYAKFGGSVSIDSNIVMIGAMADNFDENGEYYRYSAGSAYLFQRAESGGWSQVQKIVASDRSTFDKFGYSVSVDNGNCIAGTFEEDHDLNGENYIYNSGSAYIFDTPTTRIVEYDSRNLLFVFPNPTYGNLNLNIDNKINEFDIVVRNILGNVTFSRNYKLNQSIELNIDGPSGLYFLSLYNKKNNYFSNIKIIKK